MGRPKAAFYWASSCGGCDISLLEIGPHLLELIEAADVVFWPIGFDGKLHDIEHLPDKSITVSFYNGAIRNSENEHIAKVLRQKSVVMIAFGSCACYGGTPVLRYFRSNAVSSAARKPAAPSWHTVTELPSSSSSRRMYSATSRSSSTSRMRIWPSNPAARSS